MLNFERRHNFLAAQAASQLQTSDPQPMKRIQEKIKDIVEARGFEAVKNYQADAGQTVAAYRFTDATSELMANWLGEIAALAHRSTGAARSLAGNRGVGKSHLLAVLSALVEKPELRTGVSDAHVAAGAQSLPRRPIKLARVERGTGATLADELRDALCWAFSENPAIFGDSVGQMLAIGAELAGANAPLVVTVDSAANRAARIKRDDGTVLGEMAEAARAARVFLVAALDDDISGADGVNAAIARTFQIDFLDQEHLYRVLDAYVFQKKPAARQILKEIYQQLRSDIPGFNWSEPRFSSLYPIHPVVADVTPAVRLYAQNFAFLPFAAESGNRALNRPANSLIALDEIFDRAEPELRKSEDLTDAFAVYDDLATNAVGQIPVMQRLQARLVLKGLFVLSLDGRGATAREIAAAMLIADENQPAAAIAAVENMLQIFVAAAPNKKLLAKPEAAEIRYCLCASAASAGFEIRLAELAALVAPEEIEQTLFGAARLRFPDWNAGETDAAPPQRSAELSTDWRGSLRRGRIFRRLRDDSFDRAENDKTVENLDWAIDIFADEPPTAPEPASSDAARLRWRRAALRREEEETLRRYHALLRHGATLEDEFNEAAKAARQTHAAQVERIWTRVFLDDARLFFETIEEAMPTDARAAKTLDEWLAIVLTPVFNRKFPAHPIFPATLDAGDAAQLINDFFGASETNSAQAQALAKSFLVPLALVARRENQLVLESDERLLRLPLAQKIWRAVESADGAIVSLNEINALLRAAPDGLSREAQHLVLTALVARRRLELVTNTGERVNRRMLGLKIAWSEVVGVVRPSVLPRSQTELINWARMLIGADAAVLPAAFDDPADAERVREALRAWLADWRSGEISKQFDELPDAVLNIRAWKLAARVGRTFGAAAEAIESILDEQAALEDGLERVAEAFYDSFEQIAVSALELEELKSFVSSAARREKIWRYVALAEATDDQPTENLRRELAEILNAPESLFERRATERIESLWREFQESFAAVYAERHDAARTAPQRAQTLEKLFAGDEWAEFENLAGLPLFHSKFWERAANLRREALRRCDFDARAILRERPACACGFRLASADDAERLPQELALAMNEGRRVYRKTLTLLGAPFAHALDALARNETESDIAARAQALAKILTRGDELPILSFADVKALERAVGKMQTVSVNVKTPRTIGANSREKLRDKLNDWLDGLPDAPFAVKLSDGEN